MFYLDVVAAADRRTTHPSPSMEAAFYVQAGAVEMGGESFGAGEFAVLEPTDEDLVFTRSGRLMMLGGEPFARTQYMEWNFVSFDKSRIEAARRLWKSGGFPKIPGDDAEYIPLA